MRGGGTPNPTPRCALGGEKGGGRAKVNTGVLKDFMTFKLQKRSNLSPKPSSSRLGCSFHCEYTPSDLKGNVGENQYARWSSSINECTICTECHNIS